MTSIRDGEFNPLLHGEKLFQQWCVDSHLQVEANNLNFIRSQQKKLKVEQYRNLTVHLQNQTDGDTQVGSTVILPSSFQGSARNMRERYHDTMSIVRKYGSPHLFITMTCNANWPEITDNLFAAQSASDRPDIVARVFNLNLKSLMDDVTKKQVFGRVKAFIYTIEFQKRGLPHAHILVSLDEENIPNDATKIDKIVTAKIPNNETEPVLHEIVKRCMMHGPCGTQNPNSPCMENNKCQKNFPKAFNEETKADVNGYPLYRRRQGATITVRNTTLDNRYVVPSTNT